MTRKILLANALGYCFGVRRAVKMVEDAQSDGGPVSTLGPIIHNTQKVQELADAGVQVVSKPCDVTAGTLVVRAHGIPMETAEQADGQGLTILDGTCPFVSNLQDEARSMHEQGYKIVLLADREHPETVGVLSYVDGTATVCKTPDEIPRFGPKDKVAVLAQTTMQPELFAEAVRKISAMAHEVRAFNTICFETEDRQAAAHKLAEQVGAAVVVGGVTSKNTEHLAKICREHGTKTIKVETATELDPAFFDGIETIGVTAGASTPDELIDEVVAWLHALDD